MIGNKKIHFANFSTFNLYKLSANVENTKYTVGVSSEVFEGQPDISWQATCYIKDVKLIWTGGQIYGGDLEDVVYIAHESDKAYNDLDVVNTLSIALNGK